MAQIKIYRDELDDLPDVCARSAEPTARRVRKTFSWHPSWVGLLLFLGLWPYLIVAIFTTKRMTVPVPLCDRHANHWLIRHLLIFGVLLSLIVLGVTAALLLEEGRGSEVGGVLCLCTIFGALAWLIMTVVLLGTAIRPTEITKDSITLAGVSREFADAVQRKIDGLGDEVEADEEAEEYFGDRKKRRREPEPPSADFRA